MTPKVQVPLPPMGVNSLDAKGAKPSSVVNPVPVDVVALFFEAVASSGLSDKEAAYAMAMDPAQLSRVKTGQARLPFDAVWRLPNRFWFDFRDRIDAAKQLTAVNRRAVQRARLVELLALLLEDVA